MTHWRWLTGILLLVSLLWGGEARALDPPIDPMLRIEGEMHTAMIRRMAMDPQERFFVTVSDDKTVRIWTLPEGNLERVLRVPINLENDGKLSAVALSPDGRFLAVGGWTGWDWDGKTSIYLFDLQTGAMYSRIGGLPNVINHLAFSPDGQFLAVALARKNGIRVFATLTGALVAADSEYGDHTYWIDFRADGVMATASYDGYVRLYSPRFTLLGKVQPRTRDRPFSLAFSPDGQLIAVGFQRYPQVLLLKADDLSTVYRPGVAEVNGKLHTVAWSPDGQRLYAGGLHQVSGKRVVRVWPERGRGRPMDIRVSSDTVMQIIPLRDGGFLYAAADPALGLVGADNLFRFQKERPIAVFRGLHKRLLVSQKGDLVQFAYDPGGASPATFSLPRLELNLSAGAADQLSPPVVQHATLLLSGLENGGEMRVNGVPFQLKNHEQVQSLAMVPDGRMVVLGTSFFVRLVTREGNEVWRFPAPATTWAVNLSGDGRVVVAAFGDGTVRWLQATTGRELLILFPHNDRRRWVLWTPEGYYAASEGAGDLIGWHKNRGRDVAASFYPASQFAFVYHRPDQVRRLLE